MLLLSITVSNVVRYLIEEGKVDVDYQESRMPFLMKEKIK
jgi:hypothetical protein